MSCSQPHVARMHDYYLSGKNNFPVSDVPPSPGWPERPAAADNPHHT
ncbi:hypothetical protein [Frankia tisae]